LSMYDTKTPKGMCLKNYRYKSVVTEFCRQLPS
jgi:hypothetical protein